MQVDVQYSAAKLGYDTDLYKATPAGSNMKTTGQYIRMVHKLYSEEIISTGKYEEMLLDAFNQGIIDENQGNTIWANMLRKRRRLGAASFSEYLSTHS